MLLLSIVIGLSAAVWVVVGVQVRMWPAADPAAKTAADIGERLRRRDRIARFVRGRLNPSGATGLALTVALAVAILAGVAVGLLVYLLRTRPSLAASDLWTARWAAGHATSYSTPILKVVTALGSTVVVIVVGTVVAIVTAVRWRNRMPIAFMLVVLAGESTIVHFIKVVVGRARPTISVLTGYHGQSFPSGHSASAAACYGGAALLLARHWSTSARSSAYGAGAAIAVAVACSRVFLGVHWVSDVVAGLAVGWGWLSLASIAFGGRFLAFGAPLKLAEPPLPSTSADGSTGSRGRPQK